MIGGTAGWSHVKHCTERAISGTAGLMNHFNSKDGGNVETRGRSCNRNHVYCPHNCISYHMPSEWRDPRNNTDTNI